MPIIYPAHLTADQARDVADEALRLIAHPNADRPPVMLHRHLALPMSWPRHAEPLVIALCLMIAGIGALLTGR